MSVYEGYVDASIETKGRYLLTYFKYIGEETFLRNRLGDHYDELCQKEVKEFQLSRSWFGHSENGEQLYSKVQQIFKDRGFEAAKSTIYQWADEGLIKGPLNGPCRKSGEYPDDESIRKWVDPVYWFLYQSARKIREALKEFGIKDRELSKRLKTRYEVVRDKYISKDLPKRPRKTLAKYNIGIVSNYKFFSHNDAGETEMVHFDYNLFNEKMPEDVYIDGLLEGNLAIKIDEMDRINVCLIYRSHTGMFPNSENAIILNVTSDQVEFLKKFMIDFYITSEGIKSECIKKEYNEFLYNHIRDIIADLKNSRLEFTSNTEPADESYEIVNVMDRIRMRPGHILEEDLYNSYINEYKIYKNADSWVDGDLALCYDLVYRGDIAGYRAGFNIVYRKDKRNNKAISSRPNRLYISCTLASKLKNKAKKDGCCLSKDCWLFEDKNPELFQYFKGVMQDLHKIYGISSGIFS